MWPAVPHCSSRSAGAPRFGWKSIATLRNGRRLSRNSKRLKSNGASPANWPTANSKSKCASEPRNSNKATSSYASFPLLIRSQDDERRRIARELHDSAGQYLGAVSIALEMAKREHDSATRKMEEAAEMAKGCAGEIRTISHLLHPPLLEELGLASAAQWYVEGFAARSGIQVEVEIPKHLDRLG